MHNIEKLLASIEWPGSYIDIDLESNFIENKVADQIYGRLMRHGNVLFDTYGMWDDINGLDLYNCLLIHYTQKEDYRRCNGLMIRKDQYLKLVGYFDRCRREKSERIKKKRGIVLKR